MQQAGSKQCREMLVDMGQFLNVDLTKRYAKFLTNMDYAAPELAMHAGALVKAVWGDFVMQRPEHDALNAIVLKHFPDSHIKSWDDYDKYWQQARQEMQFITMLHMYPDNMYA